MSAGPPPAAPPSGPEANPGAGLRGLRRKVVRVLLGFDPVAEQQRLDRLERMAAAAAADAAARLAAAETRLSDAVQALQAELERQRDQRVPALERRLDAAEEAGRGLQAELERLRDERLVGVERRLDGLDATTASVEELRAERLPALSARTDVLVDRLAEGLEELGSLVERQLRHEPLPLPRPSRREDAVASALAEVQPLLLEAFRGSDREIRHRLDEHLALLRGAAPVLDLGCGRGELLEMLREAAVDATGIECDPALAGAARRRGVKVLEGDAAEMLAEQPEGAWGAVTAFHLLEHLEPGRLLDLLHAIRRVLRPGGLLLAECPNPHSLRVGGALFWLDPTHARPLLPETLDLLLRAAGFEVDPPRFLHPFPAEQRLSGRGGGAQVEELARRLDELLNAPRDFVLAARRPNVPRSETSCAGASSSSQSPSPG